MPRRSILVINPPNRPYTDASLLIEPIDVLTVASFLSSLGHGVRMIDMDILQAEPSSIVTTLEELRPEYTVIPFDYHIPLYTSEALEGVVEIARLARERGSRVIIGGRPSNRYPQLFLDRVEAVIVVSEMEPALEELLALEEWDEEAIARIPGLILRGSCEPARTPRRQALFDLDRLPITDRSLVDLDRYIDVRTILSSRGCVERCGFCPVHGFWGRWRARSAGHVADEIQHLVEQHGAAKILFLDDHATVNSRRMREISTILIDRGVRTTLGCLGTVSAFDDETVALMQRAGFRWIHYGAEFGTQPVLDFLNKRMTVEQIRSAIKRTKEAGLRVRASWILDSPTAGEEGLEATIDLILETAPHEVRAHFLALRACAPFADSLEGSRLPGQQHIHEGGPHSGFKSLDPQLILRKIERLTTELERLGYLVIRKASEWRRFDDPSIGKPDTKFISFCPGRYGVGWAL